MSHWYHWRIPLFWHQRSRPTFGAAGRSHQDGRHHRSVLESCSKVIGSLGIYHKSGRHLVSSSKILLIRNNDNDGMKIEIKNCHCRSCVANMFFPRWMNGVNLYSMATAWLTFTLHCLSQINNNEAFLRHRPRHSFFIGCICTHQHPIQNYGIECSSGRPQRVFDCCRRFSFCSSGCQCWHHGARICFWSYWGVSVIYVSVSCIV